MSMLPDGFAALSPFAGKWAVAGEAARAAVRSHSTPQERRAFYNAAQPLLGAALDHLDGRSLSSLDESDGNLMRMVLSLANVALAVETLRPTRHGMPSRGSD